MTPGRLVAPRLDFGIPGRNASSGFSAVGSRQYFHYAEHARTLSSIAAYWLSISRSLAAAAAQKLTALASAMISG
jgi:hypothetical protein